MVTYVVTRPGRELLFTVVSQEEKYKAKVSTIFLYLNFIFAVTGTRSIQSPCIPFSDDLVISFFNLTCCPQRICTNIIFKFYWYSCIHCIYVCYTIFKMSKVANHLELFWAQVSTGMHRCNCPTTWRCIRSRNVWTTVWHSPRENIKRVPLRPSCKSKPTSQNMLIHSV